MEKQYINAAISQIWKWKSKVLLVALGGIVGLGINYNTENVDYIKYQQYII